ncbi:EpsI family protein [Sphingomonas sp. SORGH_AS802]|uniref:exosortase-associated protein EpsI, V-type n=1 Tax=unclassified Sphingomonas TaxID=196159 RepID=UPI00285D41E7|nr:MULTISPECIES: exosortase-associated protein EpsI, V-type [unclassified Sphingomonas]MDR6127688.1 EpsI family protein [Sphingomonas sp. SORGH_AS_0438]MDR6133399.1 EpsI family protein [Sphingomonas sp. SORGH_AS_0802]
MSSAATPPFDPAVARPESAPNAVPVREGDPISRRKMMIGLALGATVAVSELYVPRRSVARMTDKSFAALFPDKVGPWTYVTASGLVLPPQDQLSRFLYEQLLTRIYAEDNGPQVMMVLAYSSVQEGRLQVHRPEVCYPAAGFTILDNEAMAIPINPSFAIHGRFLVADRGARREYVFYWTRVGPNMPIRWFDQRLFMAKANLQGYIPDGLLARVSVIAEDREEAVAALTHFVQTMVKTVGPAGRKMLIGPH